LPDRFIDRTEQATKDLAPMIDNGLYAISDVFRPRLSSARVKTDRVDLAAIADLLLGAVNLHAAAGGEVTEPSPPLTRPTAS
jgi:hypothetical protein